jgi:hypothetical protein
LFSKSCEDETKGDAGSFNVNVDFHFGFGFVSIFLMAMVFTLIQLMEETVNRPRLFVEAQSALARCEIK